MFIIERFEEDFAVLEDLEKDCNVKIKKALLPKEARESDVIMLVDGRYNLDLKETEKRRNENIELLRKLGL